MYSDNDLNALLDGELGDAEASKLREALNNDTALADRLEKLAMADSIVKSTYQGIESDPVPQAILDMLGEEHDIRSAGTNVVQLNPASIWSRPMQAAAVLVLSVGLFLGSTMLRGPQTDPYITVTALGPIEAQSELSSVLNERLSASKYDLTGSNGVVSITPVLSFQSVNGDWCREYLATSDFDAARVLACKQDSQWRILFAAAGQQQVESENYATASSSTSETFDAQIDKLIDSDALSVEQEQELIIKGWE